MSLSSIKKFLTSVGLCLLSCGIFHNTTFAQATFSYKIADSIAPFFSSAKPIKHFSSLPYDQLDTATYPFVDMKQLADAKTRFVGYITKMKSDGYNAISLDDVNHLVTLDSLHIYSPNDPVYIRNKAYQTYFAGLIAEAKKQNLKVFITTDMPFYTNAIQTYV